MYSKGHISRPYREPWQEAWQLQPLVKATDQPVAWLREVLSGIAVLTKRPKERDAWVIKPEYRSKAGSAG